jgi:ankyrin repeat protein
VDRLHARQDNREHREEHQAILNWLTPLDYAAQQSDFISRRQEGTGQWLLNSDKFEKWVDQTNQTLFCPGIPGAGKTISASIVIDELYVKFQNDVSVGIAYIYCNFRQQQEQKPVDLLASLLKQFIQGLPSVPQSMIRLYEHHQEKRTRPSFDEISHALQSVVPNYSKAFIVTDALDECQVFNGGRKRFLAELFNIQAKTGASLLATSRFIPEIEKEFEGRSARLEIRASDNDLQRYLDGHMFRLPSFVSRSTDLQKEVKTAIINAVDGMYVLFMLHEWINTANSIRFLLAQLHLDSLIGKRSPKAIKAALGKLPRGSQAYDHAYKEAMERIEGQVGDSQELAKQVLSWITCAKRPLTTSELRHALAVEIGGSELDKENLPEIEDVLSVCAGLVVDEESGIIRLVHYTTQEYFERTWTSWFPNAQKDITMICVTYLSFDTFKTGFCPTDKEFEARLQSNPLYDYAARNWGCHTRAASTGAEQLILDFLENEAKVSGSSQAMMASGSYSDYSQDVPRQIRGVHLAAYFGLKEAIMALLKNGHDPDSKDNSDKTPLSWAAENGHEAVVKLLLERGAELKFKDYYDRTPLSWAAENGHEAVVKLLLEKGAELESKDHYDRTPLSRAAENGHEAVVKLLLEKGVELESKDITGWTPLSLAAGNGYEAVVKLLLEKGAELESKDTTGWTPLSLAAGNGYEAVVKLLLEKGAELESKDHYDRTPLSLAAGNGYEAVARLLLEKGAELESKDSRNRTPLSWAIGKEHEAVARLLLEKGAELGPRDSHNRTPLSWAIGKRHEAVARLLQSHDGLSL